ncbi:MAG: MMPL family transporter [Pseudomonadales bacterium]|nr:MMPL family transporter [Pseudomonadales bacterium]
MKTSFAMADFLVKHRNRLAIFSLIIVFFASLGGSHLGFSTNYRDIFMEDNRQLVDFDQLQSIFHESETLVFLVTPASGNIFDKNALISLEQLHKDCWQTPYSQGVHSLLNFQRNTPSSEGFSLDYLVPDASTISKEEIESIEKFVLSEPLLKGRLVGFSGEVTAILVNIAMPENRRQANSEIVAFAQQLKQRYQAQYPGMQIHLTGGVMVSDSFLQVAIHDAINLFPIMVIIGLLIQGILFHSISAVLASMATVFFSILFTMGIAGWLGYSLNQTSALAPMLVLTLALADSTHIITHYISLLRSGLDRFTAIKNSIAENLQAIFLTSVTTSIGLLCMNFSDSPPFHDFANITAIGVMSAFVLTLTVLPSILMALPMRVTEKDLNLTLLMIRISHIAIKQRRFFFIAISVLVLFSAYFIPANELNDDLLDYFDESLEIRQATNYASAHFKGARSITLALDSGEQQGINQTNFLHDVDTFGSWLRHQQGVNQVVSWADSIKQLNQNMHQGDADFYKIPESSALASQYLLLYEMSLKTGQDINDQINFDRSTIKLTVFVDKMKNSEIIELETRIKTWLGKNLPHIKVIMGSQTLMFAHLGQQVIESMMIGSFAALVLVTVVIAFGLKSWRYGLISLIPNAFPAAVVYGLWGLFVGEINQAAAVTFSVSLGIIVDDTVHILSKYISRLKQGDSPEAALHYTFTTTGTALIITSVVLTAGLLVLAQSTFGINATIGAMVAPIIVFALIVDFFFLPALLIFFDQQKNKTSRS